MTEVSTRGCIDLAELAEATRPDRGANGWPANSSSARGCRGPEKGSPVVPERNNAVLPMAATGSVKVVRAGLKSTASMREALCKCPSTIRSRL